MFGTKEVTTITNTPMPFWLKRSTLEFNFYPALPSLGRCGNPLCISALAIARPLHVGVVGEVLLPCEHGGTSGLFPQVKKACYLLDSTMHVPWWGWRWGMDPPLPRRTLQGPGRCRAFVGHDLACGVFGMSLPGYVVDHTAWKAHVFTALDRTRATH